MYETKVYTSSLSLEAVPMVSSYCITIHGSKKTTELYSDIIKLSTANSSAYNMIEIQRDGSEKPHPSLFYSLR